MGEISATGAKSKIELMVPAKVANLIGKHSSGAASVNNMFVEQFNYGHREILLQFTGLDFSSQLIGNLQHGIFAPWSDVDYRTPTYLWGRKTKFWVFSKYLEVAGKKKGFKNVVAIGAPWSYIPRKLIELNHGKKDNSGKILIMPMHSQGDTINQSTVTQKNKRAKLFREASGSSEATVCLHYFDYLDIETTRAFKDYGFEVTCLGLGAISPPWSRATGRLTYLPRLMKLMDEHEFYLTDGFGTSLFYAIDSQMKVGIFTEIEKEFSIGARGLSTKLDSKSSARDESNHFFHQELPNLVNRFGYGHEYLSLSDEWLGKDCMRNPQELIEILDYKIGVYPDFEERVW